MYGKKGSIILLSPALPNAEQFLKFFLQQAYQQNSGKLVIKDSVIP